MGRCKSEGLGMHEYFIDEKYECFGKSVTKGTQKKYFKDGYYYKLNKNGNEGFTEYLVSRLLANSNVPKSLFVHYEYCKIKGKLGCRSKSFLPEGSKFISMSSIYTKQTGYCKLSEKLQCFRSATDRLNYILDQAENYGVTRSAFRNYLNILLQLDMLILNVDRHEHNYGVVCKGDIITPSIIFDNGLSLNTNRLNCNNSCTISGSFTEQVVAFGFPVKPLLKIDYPRMFSDLKRIEKLYGKRPEIDVLRIQLQEYAYLFML